MASLFSTLVLFGTGPPGHAAQAPSPANPALPQAAETVEMPHDPGSLMILADRLNGLAGEGIKPWHLKVSYTLTDEKGATKEQGTAEEFWAGPRKIRTTYVAGGETMTTYTTEDGSFRTGSLAQPNGLVSEALEELIRPLPAPAYLQHAEFEIHHQTVGKAKLSCVSEKPLSDIQRVGPAPGVYCFESDKPILRIAVSGFGSRQTVRNEIARFQGKYVPREVRITAQDKTALTLHLESLESLAAIVDADFTPPPDAKLLPRMISVSSVVAQSSLIRNSPPRYPSAAKERGITGTIVIKVRIGTDGHIHDPEVLSGPSELRQAAFDAIKDWVYRPYLLNGEAVDVDTQINIVFKLGG
jgi:TonB family protein